MVNVTNSINASINQQKAVRGYMFHFLKGNSTAPTMLDLVGTYDKGSIEFGSAVSIGWREKSIGQKPFGACFKFTRFLGDPTEETCEDANAAEEDGKSTYIRVFTFYGICGTSYHKVGNFYQSDDRRKGLGNCILSN